MNSLETKQCLELIQHFTGCNLKNDYLIKAVISNHSQKNE